MVRQIIINIFRFIFLILLQVLVLNNMQFSGLVNPYLYILFILLLPFEIPGWILLVIGFLTGLSIDAFTDTLGLHTSATVLMAFLRPFILRIIAPRDGYDSGKSPNLNSFGLPWFLRYSIILIFAHHFVLFYLEVFRISDFFTTLLRIILSSLFTILLVLLSQIFMYRKKSDKSIVEALSR
jgi:rod shape-determining protein MreD